jgi:hypothetical protein
MLNFSPFFVQYVGWLDNLYRRCCIDENFARNIENEYFCAECRKILDHSAVDKELGLVLGTVKIMFLK